MEMLSIVPRLTVSILSMAYFRALPTQVAGRVIRVVVARAALVDPAVVIAVPTPPLVVSEKALVVRLDVAT